MHFGAYPDSWRYLAELNWDALWMQLWDAYKLCHAARLPGVEEVFLIAIATEREWSRQVEPVSCSASKYALVDGV